MDASLIYRYFPDLTAAQRAQFEDIGDLYTTWNARINVISRKDIQSIYLHHILHSLSIARTCRFADTAQVLDAGCGGGFPSVPLAILFPQVHFTAVDSVGKKIRVVEEVCRGAGITNITPVNGRIEQGGDRYDYVVSRAVASAAQLKAWTWKSLRTGQCGSLPNGILLLKGGALAEELAESGLKWQVNRIVDYFSEEYFTDKYVLYAQR